MLANELRKRGLFVSTQQDMPIVFEGTYFDCGFRADLVVENVVIVEVKSVESITQVHKKQLLTYLRLGDKRLGLLINFNIRLLRDGLVRIINGLAE